MLATTTSFMESALQIRVGAHTTHTEQPTDKMAGKLQSRACTRLHCVQLIDSSEILNVWTVYRLSFTRSGQQSSTTTTTITLFPLIIMCPHRNAHSSRTLAPRSAFRDSGKLHSFIRVLCSSLQSPLFSSIAHTPTRL